MNKLACNHGPLLCVIRDQHAEEAELRGEPLEPRWKYRTSAGCDTDRQHAADGKDGRRDIGVTIFFIVSPHAHGSTKQQNEKETTQYMSPPVGLGSIANPYTVTMQCIVLFSQGTLQKPGTREANR